MNNRLIALRQRLNLSLPDALLLASALLMLLVCWSLPWQTVDGTSLTAAGVLGQALNQNLTPAIVLIPIMATLAVLLTLWGLASDQYKRLAIFLALLAGIGGLLYYASVFFFAGAGELSTSTLNTTGLGFWLTLLTSVGLIVQFFLPRDEELEPLRLDGGALLPLIGLVLVGVILLRAQFTIAAGSYSLETFVRQVIFGSAQGSVYALIALGYTLVYGILFMINFAHGEVFMGGAYVGFFFIEAMNQSGFLEQHALIALLIVFAAAITTSIVIAIGLERIAYRPLRTAPRLVPLITAIGASIFLQQAFRGLFGSSPKVYPNVHFYVLPQVFREECDVIDGAEICQGLDLVSGRYPIEIFGIEIIFRPIYAVVFITAIVMMLGLWFFVQRTKTGKAMRAVAEDKPTAALMGINVDSVIVTTFVLGAALAGVAGVLFALYNRQVTHGMGFTPGLKAFTAAVLGGIGNIRGAAVGGFFLGLVEAVAPSLLDVPTQLKDVIAFGILVLVLIFRPSGILGEVLSEKKA